MKLRLIAPLAAALSWAPACGLAHAGHAAAASPHWHATDTVGLMLVAGVAALAVWLSRGRK